MFIGETIVRVTDHARRGLIRLHIQSLPFEAHVVVFQSLKTFITEPNVTASDLNGNKQHHIFILPNGENQPLFPSLILWLVVGGWYL